jgi:hypothetical protein
MGFDEIGPQVSKGLVIVAGPARPGTLTSTAGRQKVGFGEVMVPACGHLDVSANRGRGLGEAIRIQAE